MHYKTLSGAMYITGVVPFESTNQVSPLCCNLQPSNLSRIINAGMADDDMHDGYVLNGTTDIKKRVPALLANVVIIKEWLSKGSDI